MKTLWQSWNWLFCAIYLLSQCFKSLLLYASESVFMRERINPFKHMQMYFDTSATDDSRRYCDKRKRSSMYEQFSLWSQHFQMSSAADVKKKCCMLEKDDITWNQMRHIGHFQCNDNHISSLNTHLSIALEFLTYCLSIPLMFVHKYLWNWDIIDGVWSTIRSQL